MKSSQRTVRQPATIVALLVFLVANVLLYATWPWLRRTRVKVDSGEAFVVRNIIRNEAYLAKFFDAIRGSKKIFYLGTSESIPAYNLAAQLNVAAGERYIVALSKGGMSPIHSALAIARAKREGIEIPPTILIVNPVYFTQSHDVIDDGWMSDMVRSPVFLQMNHGDVRAYLSRDVGEVYDEHFALRRFLYPAIVQEYLGNLLYLAFHQNASVPKGKVPLPMPVYKFDGSLPEYDQEGNTWTGNEAVDRFSKGRWKVNSVAESVNVKGLVSIISVFKQEPAPVLLIFLPANKKFYQYYGVNIEEFDRRYKSIRNAIRNVAVGETIYFLDLYDFPVRFGFRDRMHMDQYGFFQLASEIVKDDTYRRFLEAVTAYYNSAPATASNTRAPRPTSTAP
jgi:hypothetical protein